MNKVISLVITITIIVFIILMGVSCSAVINKLSQHYNNKIEAIINGTIECEVDYYYEYGNGIAKIITKDGTIYHTSNYTIIENGETYKIEEF